MTLKEILII